METYGVITGITGGLQTGTWGLLTGTTGGILIGTYCLQTGTYGLVTGITGGLQMETYGVITGTTGGLQTGTWGLLTGTTGGIQTGTYGLQTGTYGLLTDTTGGLQTGTWGLYITGLIRNGSGGKSVFLNEYIAASPYDISITGDCRGEKCCLFNPMLLICLFVFCLLFGSKCVDCIAEMIDSANFMFPFSTR